MTNEELVMEYRKTENEETLTEICRKNQGLIGMIVKNFRSVYEDENKTSASIIESDDLMQYGYIGLLKAVRIYDPDKGSFANAAIWWIRQEILRSMDNNEHTIRMSVDTRHKLVKLRRFRRSFVNEYGFEPRIDEISAFLEVSRPVAERLLKVEAQDQIGSLNSPIKDADGEYEVMDTVPDEHNHYEDLEQSMFEDQARKELWASVDTLKEKESLILHERYQNGKTLQEIGDDLGITRERVRQIESESLKILRHRRAIRELARWYNFADMVSYKSVSTRSFQNTHTSATERAAIMKLEHENMIRKAVKIRDRMDDAGLTRQEQDALVRAERERISEILQGG